MMKLLLTGLTTAVLLAGSAVAADCDRPAKPKLPDAKRAKTAEMEAAQKQMETYTAAVAAHLKCLDKARTDAQSEHKAIVDQWNKAVDQYAKRPS